MIVVVIVAVLLGVALPSYQNAMQKGRRTDAKEMLMSAANRQEQFMLDRSSYAEDLQALGYDGGAGDPVVSTEGHYQVNGVATGNCAADTATCYVLQATPVSGDPQEHDSDCTSFTIDNKSDKLAKDAQGVANDDCW
jgi:type IV pilus assembly protein PilE